MMALQMFVGLVTSQNDCKRDWLWARSLLEKIKYLCKSVVSRQSTALSSAIQYAMPPELG